MLGRITDHDRGKILATKAIAFSPDTATAVYILAQLAERFHRFEEANALLDRAVAAGYPTHKIDVKRAAVLQATGRYTEALVLRERMAKENPGIDTLGALASLLAEMDEWSAAENCYAAALDADHGVSPLPCGQLLFEWGVSAMRRGDLDQAEAMFAELDAILPAHAPGRGHRAEVALARGQLDFAERSSSRCSQPPTILNIVRSMRRSSPHVVTAKLEAKRNMQRQSMSCCWRDGPKPMSIMLQPSSWGWATDRSLLLTLPSANWKLRDTPRSRSLLAKARSERTTNFSGEGECSMSVKIVHQGHARRKVVVIGGGFAGMAVVASIARQSMPT